MKENLTDLVFIIDRSGSMNGLESDTIGGFNSMLSKQQAEVGEATVTTVLFDHEYETLHDRLDIQAVSPITGNEYFVRGSTALLDAIGKTIKRIRKAHKHTTKDTRPEKTLVVIITDGQENASREYSVERIKSRIERQKSKHGWEFIFLGANIDAVKEAEQLGIDEANAQQYHADSAGLSASYTAISAAVSCMRGTGSVGKSWKNIVDKDFKYRKK